MTNKAFCFFKNNPITILTLLFLFEFVVSNIDLSGVHIFTQVAAWLSEYVPVFGNWPNGARGQEIKNYMVFILFTIPVSVFSIFFWLVKQDDKTLSYIMVFPGDKNKNIFVKLFSFALLVLLLIGSLYFVFFYGDSYYLKSGNALRQSAGKYNFVLNSNAGMWFVLALWHFGIVLSSSLACFLFNLNKWLVFLGSSKDE